MPLADDPLEARAWLDLAFTDGIGPVACRRLLEIFGSGRAILAADPARLGELLGPRAALALRAGDRRREAAVEASLAWAAQPGHHLLVATDPRYPPRLLQIADPPAVLHVVGLVEALSRPMLAIVGSRNASAAGLERAHDFARSLSAAGRTIVSGLALGIDASAHEGALSGGAGTVAVVGTGIDRVYPRAHLDLARRIRDDGAIVSELPLGAPPLAAHFPRRNRVIAALAEGVLVVEAALRSGSLITARQAADFGREVFAIPGSIDSPLARGCHSLIRQGAKLVECCDDVLEDLPPVPAGVAAPSAAVRAGNGARGRGGRFDGATDARAASLLAVVGFDPVWPQSLCQRLDCEAGELAAQLLELELAGLIERLSDGRIVRRARAGSLASAGKPLL